LGEAALGNRGASGNMRPTGRIAPALHRSGGCAVGDINQYVWIEKGAANLEGPFLEVGSKNYGSTQDLRRLFSGRGKYVGVDMAAGNGVDVVLDLTRDFAEVDRALSGERFGSIFCLSVLEHCDQPFRMADNLTRL